MTNSETALLGVSLPEVRSLLRWVAVGVGVLGVALLTLLLAIRIVIDAGFLERRLNSALDEATGGRYRAEIEAVQWAPLANSLYVEKATLRPDLQAFEKSERRVPRRIYATVSELRLDGLHPWTLMWNRRLILDEVTVRHPHVRIQRGTDVEASGQSSNDSSEAVQGPIADLRVDRFRVKDGTFTRVRGSGPSTDSLWGLSMQFDSLSTDAVASQSPRQYLGTHFLEGDFEGFRQVFTEKGYVLRLGPGRVSQRDSVLRVEDIRFAPSVSDEAFMRRHEYRVNRFRTRAARVEVAGFEYRRLVETGAIHAANVGIDTLALDVYRNNHLPERPNDPPPPMPQDAMQMLDRSLRIDTLRVWDSRIRYTKRPEGISKTGSIWFDDLRATCSNLTNDPERMAASTPAVIDARTRVNGAGHLHTTLRIPLRAPKLALSFRGRLGEMDARVFNETFVPLGGVRIESGQVDSLWFQSDVKNGVARGSVGGIYQKLEVELLDKGTGDRGIRNRLETVATGLALRPSNLPEDGDLETGQIQHTHDPDNSFFKFLWHALRDGIYSLVGIDRLPG